MNKRGCRQQKATVVYPQHAFPPEDLLHFIESNEFTATWEALGLDDEDDLMSLQLCIMAGPEDCPVIDGTGGLRVHVHSFTESGISKPDVAAYYAYFAEYGIAYFTYLDGSVAEADFSPTQRAAIREVLSVVKDELDRRKTIT